MATKQQYAPSVWKGSQATATNVQAQIAERYGEQEAQNYDPRKNCFTFMTWRAMGYSVRKGEKALHSYTYVKKSEVAQVNGKSELVTTASYPKHVCLFYYLQVDKR